MAHYLICYDIANPRRLARVHRRIVKHALFVQLSVYYLQGSKEALQKLLDELSEVIDPRYDDVRAYPVEPLHKARHWGRQWLPEGITLYD